MRTTILIIASLLILLGCEKKEEFWITLEDPNIPDNAANVRLRPNFGFNYFEQGSNVAINNSVETEYYFCDTVNPPQKLVLTYNVLNDISKKLSQEERLEPNKKYYWYCDVNWCGENFKSDIYSFTTMDTNQLYDKTYDLIGVFYKEDYDKLADWENHFANLNDSMLFFSEPVGFTLKRDSVFNIYRYFDGIIEIDSTQSKGIFQLTDSNINIANWIYSLVEYGYEFFGSETTGLSDSRKVIIAVQKLNIHNRSIVTVYKETDMDNTR